MNNNKERFKLLKQCLPPLENGVYTLGVEQKTTKPQEDQYERKLQFCIKGAHFSLPPETIEAVYPKENATGNYADSMGHITLKKKTFPWENSIQAEAAATYGPLHAQEAVKPWLALICVASEEDSIASQITVQQLLDTTKQNGSIFYPIGTMPACTEKAEDICQVIDLSTELFERILPREEEVAYLCHVKAVDQYDKCDEYVSQEGLYSVVVANRFIPSGISEMKKSTLHLVSLEGFHGFLPEGENFRQLQNYQRIRMVSLYHWNVNSTQSEETDFKVIMRQIDSGALAMVLHEVLRRGQVPLGHITRTGEETVSLYAGPLLPYSAKDEGDKVHPTADGYMIYDPEHGIMDLSYSAAWQLGRLLVLKNSTIASALLRWKRENAKRVHLAATKAVLEQKLHKAIHSVKGDIADYCADKIIKEIVDRGLIGPIAKDPKDRRGRAE